MMNMLLALAYPFCCMVVMYVADLLAMIINLVDGSRWARFSWSTREWRLCYLAIWAGSHTSFFRVFFRAMAHVFVVIRL